jgi:integrase
MKKPSKLPVEILTRQEVLDLMAACSRRAPTGIRNRALIAVMWRCGLRISEALALKPKDIDGERRTVSVLHGKSDKSRKVGIDAQTLDTIAAWLEIRKTLKIGASKPLFCQITTGSEGNPIDTSYIRHLLPRLATKAGIGKRVHAHGLRHTHAVELMRDEKQDVVTIQGALGHSSVAVTNTYLAHLNPQDVIDAVRSRVW